MIYGCNNKECKVKPVAVPYFWNYCPHCGCNLVDVSKDSKGERQWLKIKKKWKKNLDFGGKLW